MSPARRVPLQERFWKYVDKSGDCWQWTGGASNGYGYIRADSPSQLNLKAHRVSYEMAHGPIPEGLFIDHRCHNKRCVNPEHLRVVTPKQNSENRAGPDRNNKSGHRGVYQSFPGRWKGKVKHRGVNYRTPPFGTPEEAAEATRLLRLSLFTHSDKDRRAA